MNPVQILMMNQQKSEGLGYGVLYNGYTIRNSRNIAPVNCHIPTQTELSTLVTYLGGASVAGGKLKEVGFIHWNSPNTGATNEVGFYGLGTGFRRPTGLDVTQFEYLRVYGYFWTSTLEITGDYYIMWIRYDSGELSYPAIANPNTGLPIRCLCDTSDSTITDIDGNVYDTVVIGTQRWLVQNLKVTKYRDGTVIPEVTNNTTWEGLTSGALCAYDNDWNNV